MLRVKFKWHRMKRRKAALRAADSLLIRNAHGEGAMHVKSHREGMAAAGFLKLRIRISATSQDGLLVSLAVS